MIASLLASESGGRENFVVLDVRAWHWIVLLAVIVAMLLVDLLVVHREAHEVKTKEAAIESAVWIGCGLAFSFVIWWWFGAAATGEYVSGYLIEKSLSIDNVFVWALIMGYFRVPQKYQHRVLFWGIFGALVMRAVFIFAGVAVIERFSWVLYIFGAFLIYTAGKLIFTDNDHVDPAESKFLKLVNRVVPTTDELDGQKLFTRQNGQRLATPLFSVLILVEVTDVVFAVDSVPAVLAVSREQFIVFASNAFAILGLARALLPAGRHAQPLHVPAAGAGDHPRLRRREDDHRRVVPHPDVALARGHRDRADRLDRLLAEVRAVARRGRTRPRGLRAQRDTAATVRALTTHGSVRRRPEVGG